MSIQTLSSAQTFTMKVMLPAMWITIFGSGTAALWWGAFGEKAGELVPSGMAIEFLVFWILGTTALLLLCAPLKRVRVDDRALLISNYRREIAVPLNMIDHVTENRWINIHPVTVHFREQTPFGRRITFMPKMRFALRGPHPVVTQLTYLAQAARQAARPS
jgi:hypothetical protein